MYEISQITTAWRAAGSLLKPVICGSDFTDSKKRKLVANNNNRFRLEGFAEKILSEKRDRTYIKQRRRE